MKLSSTAKLRMINDMPSTMRARKDLPILPNLLEGPHADLSPRLTFAQLSGVLVPSKTPAPHLARSSLITGGTVSDTLSSLPSFSLQQHTSESSISQQVNAAQAIFETRFRGTTKEKSTQVSQCCCGISFYQVKKVVRPPSQFEGSNEEEHMNNHHKSKRIVPLKPALSYRCDHSGGGKQGRHRKRKQI